MFGCSGHRGSPPVPGWHVTSTCAWKGDYRLVRRLRVQTPLPVVQPTVSCFAQVLCHVLKEFKLSFISTFAIKFLL